MNNTWEADFASRLPPIWLYPITLAASRIYDGLENNGRFERLKTLNVSLKGKGGKYLALLFRLPSLQELRLAGIDSFPNSDWPESDPISKVHTLEVEGSDIPSSIVARMIGYCQALQSLFCHRESEDGSNSSLIHKEDTREWCARIVNALRRHSATLKRLDLVPYDFNLHENSETGFQRLDLRSFEALEFLSVSSIMLMGRPPGAVADGKWSPTGEWQYPSICDVMPPRLQHLELHMRPGLTPGNHGFENFFMSGLSSKLNEDSSRVNLGLKRVDLNYMYLEYDRTLPMDFWQVQHAFRNAGSKFEYNIILYIDRGE
jgi:hypothetical protein